MRRFLRPVLLALVLVIGLALMAAGLATGHPACAAPLAVGVYVAIKEWRSGDRRSS